jgi:hypothetical protein
MMLESATTNYQYCFSNYFLEILPLVTDFIGLPTESSLKLIDLSPMVSEFSKSCRSCPPTLLLGFVGYSCARCLDFSPILEIYSKLGLVEQEKHMLTYMCSRTQAVISMEDVCHTLSTSTEVGEFSSEDDSLVEHDFLSRRSKIKSRIAEFESEDEEPILLESFKKRRTQGNKSTELEGQNNSFQVRLFSVTKEYNTIYINVLLIITSVII